MPPPARAEAYLLASGWRFLKRTKALVFRVEGFSV